MGCQLGEDGDAMAEGAVEAPHEASDAVTNAWTITSGLTL